MTAMPPSAAAPSLATLPLDPLRFPLWGSRLIEASAGTGKTYTIAALYLRLVLQHGGEQAFGRPLAPPDILVVTFTDAATQELRDRIRHRLSEAAQLFAQDPEDACGDERVDPLLLALRADYPASRWPACARLLHEAANWMDEAAVSTIHSWCYRMLREHAFDSGSLFQQTLITDQSELLTQVVQDYWRRQFYDLPASSLRSLLQVVATPQALQEAIAPMLSRQNAVWRYEGEVLAQAEQVDLAALLAKASEAAERQKVLEDAARALWQQSREELEQLLGALVPGLNGVTYPKKDEPGVFAAWLEALADWSEGAPAPAKIRAFSQSGIKTKKGVEVPAHAALAAMDVWLDAVAQDAQAATPLKPLLLRHASTHVQQAWWTRSSAGQSWVLTTCSSAWMRPCTGRAVRPWRSVFAASFPSR